MPFSANGPAHGLQQCCRGHVRSPLIAGVACALFTDRRRGGGRSTRRRRKVGPRSKRTGECPTVQVTLAPQVPVFRQTELTMRARRIEKWLESGPPCACAGTIHSFEVRWMKKHVARKSTCAFTVPPRQWTNAAQEPCGMWSECGPSYAFSRF